jgi:very-short-patch-repair endonuclease
VPEYRFSPDRRWRFDFAHPATRIAIELDGGTWSGGRHVQGAGFAADAEKHNAAMGAGWRVWHLTGEMITAHNLEMIANRIIASHDEPQAKGPR